ncbi:helix-turn-helix domain-containing protein [Streptomyces fulvoviolaceus]|uniref:helix-turn-helix domain-containing protein n=1 Tax=Streptomyces fulvoviolaceus TaxID=285535 RepID=UPI0021C1DB0C|nr:helix-turn-helix transcriptional regulator [Streptomyces fulvoviolaceus]MCT9076927.1 helix-turn-helix transcriptional regulator [Streptomyces fulvoviolaceus]
MIRGGMRGGVLSAPQAYVLGHRLRAVREEQGLTRGQAADVADLFPTWISQIEGGEIHDLDTMRAYAHALGTRITGLRAARIRRS